MSLAFLVVRPRDFEANRLAEELLERSDVAMCGPQFELGVSRGAQTREVIVAARIQVDPFERLGVASVEPLCQANHRRERLDRAPHPARQISVAFVRFLGRPLAVIARDERDRLDLLRLEPSKIAVLDQIVRVPVVALVADVHADVVEQRAILEPVPFSIPETVHAARLIEDRERQPSDVLGMFRPVPTALTELDDAAAADVGVALHLPDPRAVAVNVIEDQPFAQRKIAEHELVGSEPADDRIEEDRAGDAEIGPARVETRNGESFLDVEGGQALAELPERLGGHAAVAKIFRPFPRFARGERAEAEDRA
jgi:hypothetical protein